MFRLGTTSYIIEADLVPNARYLTEKVADMQLVLFAVDDGPCNFPTPDAVAALADVRAATGLSYTVHLPRDLAPDLDHDSVRLARQVIELMQPLRPRAYVAHLDGRAIRAADTPFHARAQWQRDILHTLEYVSGWLDDPAQLCIENLEGYALDLLPPIAARLPVSRCVDIGHLWLDGHDPLPYLQEALPRTRVIHLHGIAECDHASLAHLPPPQLDAVLHYLLQAGYADVLTLEIFGEPDFASSLVALNASLARANGQLAVGH